MKTEHLYILSGLVFILSVILTYLIRIYALKYRILDIPNERSSHTDPTARGGGLAIVICWYIGLTCLFFNHSIDKTLYFALIPGILLACVSLIDDLIHIKPALRLLTQIISVSLSLIILKGIGPIDISIIEIKPSLILNIVTIIGAVWFINLYNFLDGIDGYASIEAIMVSIVMYAFTMNAVNLILVAATLGFLIWNWPKAKIFMGDIGSTQLGFVLVILGIQFNNELEFSIVQWIMLTSLFWFDATLTLFRRWRNKEKLTVAHKKHAYQRAVQSGLTHQKAILVSLVMNLFIIVLIILTKVNESLIIPLFLVNILFLYIVTKLIDKKVPFIKG
jgi:Fuc2NAc and GlcNAc transferase